MKVIYKYEIHEGVNKVLLPKGADVIHGGFQEAQNILAIWAVVDPNREKEMRTFLLWNTGTPFPDSEYDQHWHINTFFMGEFVFHIFEVTTGIIKA